MLLIGAGRIGHALRDAAVAKGVDCVLVDRVSGWQALEGRAGSPIVLCVRNDDLDPVIERIPEHRYDDLVFVQNGALREFLTDRDLGHCTRGLLYFAVPKRGAPIDPGRTSWLCGDHAVEVASFLEICGVRAEAVDWLRFGAYELEKLAWLAVFGPLCEAHDATVGEVVAKHRNEVATLADEVRLVGRAVWNVDLPSEWFTERLCDYSLSIPTFRAAVKEWKWRNGWLLDISERRGLAMPASRALLGKLGHLEQT